jgi:non-heme chloroperoxidase
MMVSQPLYATAKDGTELFVQDWGSGRPVLFLAAWTFNSSIWGSQIVALNAKGYRCVAPDRRGHGRSDMPATGYDLDTLTDDVAAVIEQRDLRDVTIVAHSMGSIEAVNYLARHGAGRVARLVLVAPTTPYLVQSDDNPDAVPRAMIDAQNAAIAQDFPKWMGENEAPFFTPDTPEATRAWIRGMMQRAARADRREDGKPDWGKQVRGLRRRAARAAADAQRAPAGRPAGLHRRLDWPARDTGVGQARGLFWGYRLDRRRS